MNEPLDELEIVITSKSTDAAKGINTFISSLKKLEKSLNAVDTSADMKGIDRLVGKIDKIGKAIEKLNPRKLQNLAIVIAGLSTNAKFGDNLKEQVEKTSAALKNAQATMQGVAISSSKTTSETIRKNLGVAEVETSDLFKKIKVKGSEAWAKFGAKAKKVFGSLIRVAGYRLIRTILKEITEGFSIGLTNAYEFSKVVGYSLSASMDKMSSSLLKMKNQLGASLGALLEMLIPKIIKLADALTWVADRITQFFAALQGHSTYLKAVDVSTTWQEATASAKEYKRTIMGFDELNVLNAQTSSSSSSSPSASEMFEEVAISENILENFEKIKKIVEAVGILLAAWKITSLLSDLGLVKGKLSTFLEIAGAIVGAFMLIDGFIDAWSNGLSFSNLNEMLGGTAILAIALGAAFGLTAGAVALLIGGIALLVVGIKDFLETGELTKESFTAIAAGVLLIGGAISMLTGNFIPLIISAFLVVWQLCYEYADEIVAYITKAAKWLLTTLKKLIIAKINYDYNYIIGRLLTLVSKGITKVINLIEKVFGETSWTKSIKETLDEDFSNLGWLLGDDFEYSFSDAISDFSSTVSGWGSKFSSAIKGEAATAGTNAGGSFSSSFTSGLSTTASASASTDWISGFYSSATSKLSDYADSMGSTFSSDLFGEIGSSFSSLLGDGSSIFSKFGTSSESQFKGFGTDAGSSFVTGLKKKLTASTLQFKVNGSTSTTTSGTVQTIKLQTMADGGYPAQGSTFIAGEVPGEYEFVGDINGKTGVVSGHEISGIGEAIRNGTSILSDLLKKNNDYARTTASKDYSPTVSVRAINDAQTRNNKRLGTTVVATSY